MTIETETQQVMEIRAVLDAAGMTFENVVKHFYYEYG
jgi:predicted urease superfamily metal-dependent hydrolase